MDNTWRIQGCGDVISTFQERISSSPASQNSKGMLKMSQVYSRDITRSLEDQQKISKNLLKMSKVLFRNLLQVGGVLWQESRTPSWSRGCYLPLGLYKPIRRIVKGLNPTLNNLAAADSITSLIVGHPVATLVFLPPRGTMCPFFLFFIICFFFLLFYISSSSWISLFFLLCLPPLLLLILNRVSLVFFHFTYPSVLLSFLSFSLHLSSWF